MKSQSIQSPEGVKLIMENIWLRHKAGLKQSPNNVFFVELPPPTSEELAKMRSEEKHDELDDETALYCGIV